MDISSPLVRVELLGGMRIRAGGRVVEHFQTQRTGALLAFLALHPGRRHQREELIDLLWPDAPLDAGRHRLSQALSWLRPRLEADAAAAKQVLWADRSTVRLNPAAVETDVAEFAAALRTADLATDTDERRHAFEQAEARYPGDLLPGYYDAWALAERQRLQDGLLSALRFLIQFHEQNGGPRRALEYARRAVAVDPLSEQSHIDLIRLLNAVGEPDIALRQYRTLEQMLARELDETPSQALRALVEQIRRSTELVAHPARAVVGPTLPSPLTRFFGREHELRDLMALVQADGRRLVTLTGPGGSGKTRMALQAGHQLLDWYGGAVWFVPLADLSNPALIPGTIAEVMHLPHAHTAPLDEIIAALAQQQALLVLDDLEHLAPKAAPLIRQLLTRLPRLSILVTSRRRLRLDGESEISVSPLPLPRATDASVSVESLRTCPSVQMFVDRVQAVRPSFQITPDNAERVARLCGRLEGIPLAIELCAAWAQTLSLDEMFARLEHRFDLLVSHDIDAPARHRTLRAAVEGSYLQLAMPLKHIFGRLSVFRGGWTLSAAEAVCRGAQGRWSMEPLAAMTDLRDRSLITADEADGVMRYQMLETLREYAAEQLSARETQQRRRAHAAYFLSLAEQAEPHLLGPDQAVWLRRLDHEVDNFRAALTWAADVGDADLGLRLAGALGGFWDARGYLEEGQTWLDRVLAIPQATGKPRAKALTMRGHLARNQGASEHVDAVMQEALLLWRTLGNERGLAAALQTAATLAYSQEDCDQAETHLTEALNLARKIGDTALVARALLNLGNIALEQADWSRAWTLYAESLSLYRAENARKGTAYALNNLGLVARYQGDLDTAEILLQDALAICRELADPTGTAEAMLNLATVARLQEKVARARGLLRDAAKMAADAGEKRILAWCLKELGHVSCAQGASALGVRLLSSSDSLRQALGISFKPAGSGEIEDAVRSARAALGETGTDAAWAAGAALPVSLAPATIHAAIDALDQSAHD